MIDQEAKAVALAMLRAGELCPSEAAMVAGVSKQLVRKWCLAAKIDWREARHRHLDALVLKLMGRRPIRMRKRALRRLAAEAKAEWDRSLAERQADVSPVRATEDA